MLFRVLLVDDEKLALASLKFAFPWAEYGFTEILATTNPAEALSLLQKERIDAAFVDIRMPKISGLDLLESSRKMGLPTVFIIVSGFSDFSYAQQALRNNALDYCLKPIEPDETHTLLHKLQKHLFFIRIRNDPILIKRLLSNEKNCCEAFLAADAPQELTLLGIFSSMLPQVLAEANALSPSDCLFFNSESALLLWRGLLPDEPWQAFLKRAKENALLVLDNAPPAVPAFQSALLRIQAELYQHSENSAGLIRLSPVSPDITKCLKEIILYISTHYNEDLNLQRLSIQFGINYAYLSQQFKKFMRMSFSEYLTSIRLQNACRLLLSTNLRVVVISEMVGYNDYHYFSNTFKKHFLMTPLQYRKIKDGGDLQ